MAFLRKIGYAVKMLCILLLKNAPAIGLVGGFFFGFYMSNTVGSLVSEKTAQSRSIEALKSRRIDFSTIIANSSPPASQQDTLKMADAIILDGESALLRALHEPDYSDRLLMALFCALLGHIAGTVLNITQFSRYALPDQFKEILSKFLEQHRPMIGNAFEGLVHPLTRSLFCLDNECLKIGTPGMTMWCGKTPVEEYNQLAMGLVRLANNEVRSTTYFDTVELFRQFSLPSAQVVDWLDACKKARRKGIRVYRTHIFENPQELLVFRDCMNPTDEPEMCDMNIQRLPIKARLDEYVAYRRIPEAEYAVKHYTEDRIIEGASLYKERYMADCDKFSFDVLSPENHSPYYFGEMIMFDGQLALMYDAKFSCLIIAWGPVPYAMRRSLTNANISHESLGLIPDEIMARANSVG